MKPAGKRPAETADGCPTLPSRRIYYFIDSLFPFHSALILHEIFPYGKRAVSEL